MSQNTPTKEPDSQSTHKSTVAGLLAVVSSVSISFGSVLFGEALVYRQTLNPLIGEGLWFVTATLALGAVIMSSFLALFLSFELINTIGKPEIQNRAEYTLIGAGGLLGTGAAVTMSAGTWLLGNDLLDGAMPAGSGESALALAAVAMPIATIFYKLYTSTTPPTTRNTGNGKQDEMSPEVVKKRTAQWSEEAAVNPAFPPGQGPNDSSSDGNNSPDPPSESRSSDNRGSGSRTDNQGLDPAELEFDWQTETGVCFDDIGGMEDLKNELRLEILKPLEDREKAEKLGVSAPNTVFYGPPGTGKTYTAEALATELGLPFASLSGADIQSKWINESASKVNTLFSEAKAVAAREGGAVVFLDELDSVLKDRSGTGNSHEEDNKVVNEFLNHLEDTKDHNIVFIGATNRLDALDDAGIRSGRIDLKVEIGKPNVEAREAILRAQLNDREHNIPDAGIKELANATDGAVAADLESIIDGAFKQLLARDGDVLQWEDIETAVRSAN